MSLIWHIVKKDLRRLWPWLALLIGAMLARYIHFYLPGYEFDGSERIALWRRAEMVDIALQWLGFTAIVLSVAALVHEDAVIGNRAFWFTRPISGMRLLAAKAITSTLALILVPLAVQLAWWLSQGYGSDDIRAQYPEALAIHASITFAAFCLALLTRNISSFALGGFVTALAVIAAHAVLIDYWLHLPSRTNSYNREAVELIVALIALPACIIHQYLTRHTRRTVVIFSGALVLCLTIYAAWSWPVFQRPSRLSKAPPSAPPTLASSTPPTPAFESRRNRSSVGQMLQWEKLPVLSFDFTLNPVPAGHAVQILKASFPDSTPLSIHYDKHITLPHAFYPADYSTTNTLLISSRSRGGNPSITSPVEGRFIFALRRPEITAKLPLTVDAFDGRGPHQLKIIIFSNAVRPAISAKTFTVILVETLPNYIPSVDGNYLEQETDAFFFSEGDTEILGEGNSRHAYVLVSRRDGSAIPADNVRVEAKVSVDGVRRRFVRADFPVRIQPSDLGDYDLIKVVAPLVGIFERQIIFPATTWTEPTAQ